MKKLVWAFGLMPFLSYSVKAEQKPGQIPDPCGGPSALLAIIDRPTQADAACVVKPGDVVIEYGYQYQRLHNIGGYANVLPQAEFRFGLPSNNELIILPPDYINLHPSDSEILSGSSATIFGLKHEIGYTQKWIYTVEGIVTTPSGNPAFGSDGWGFAFNGIVSYAITPTLDFTAMIGGTTETDPSANGGKRFESFNPDLVLTWQLTPKFDIFGEVYGQTHTNAEEGFGYNADVGVLYLITQQIVVDAEYGTRLSGNLGGFSHYFGVGGAVMF